jgi:DNA polymerase III delta prime subunit
MENPGQPRLWLLKNAHNILPFRNTYSEEECMRLLAFQRMIENMHPGNKLVLCYLSDTQVPIELSQNSHRVGFAKIPMPDFEERKVFWERLLGSSMAADLSKLTDGLALTALRTLVRLAVEQAERQHTTITAMPFREWERVVAYYKFGETQDYYRQITPEQLDGAFKFFTEQEGVRGQDYAVTKAIAMLWKATTNVSALLRSGLSTPPRGILFLCGPSGVGKTYLAKKIAKFLFGSEEAFHRVDMSEYQQDFAMSRLIGSPPGYVGYEAGGELTNALRERPFSVVLFDEVEKAHPRVFDLFLQILSDGRLTDSHGRTVFFSEAIVVFTSNIGTRASEMPMLLEAQQSNNPERVREHFLKCIHSFFRYEISRPELLNRIGNNIVPFNFIDEDAVIASTVNYYLLQLRDRFNVEYETRGLRLEIAFDQVTRFIATEYNKQIREFGGRAVLNTLDDTLMPLLAKRLLALQMHPMSGQRTLMVDVATAQGRRGLTIRME